MCLGRSQVCVGVKPGVCLGRSRAAISCLWPLQQVATQLVPALDQLDADGTLTLHRLTNIQI